MARVLIVDDEPDMRFLIRAQIERANHGLAVAGEAADGWEAIDVWRQTRPDVIVLDHQMPGPSGVEVADTILATQPDQIIILYTVNPTNPQLRGALTMGVRKVLDKARPFTLIDTIRTLTA